MSSPSLLRSIRSYGDGNSSGGRVLADIPFIAEQLRSSGDSSRGVLAEADWTWTLSAHGTTNGYEHTTDAAGFPTERWDEYQSI